MEDEAYQTKVIDDAEELAESDLEMGQIGDRFIQAGVIEVAADLREKDEALFDRADAILVAACAETATGLVEGGMVNGEDLETVARLIASLWNTSVEDEAQ